MVSCACAYKQLHFILDVGMEKEQKQELGWRASVLPIPAFHYCELLYALQVHSIQWNAGMGNTDTLHLNSCFSYPTSFFVTSNV